MSEKFLDVLFSPAEFAQLSTRDLSGTTCVVFDILRATTSIVTALHEGAEGVIPVSEIPEALDWKKRLPEALLAGERHGYRITSKETGSIDFDLGNSPREFTSARVKGKTIVMSTTNGTRALRACHGAEQVLIGSLLNLSATANFLRAQNPKRVVVVCSGTYEEASFEDALGAGGLVELVWEDFVNERVTDASQIVRQLWRQHRADLPGAMRLAWNGRRLLQIAELAGDVEFAAGLDRIGLAARCDQSGLIRPVRG